MNPTPHPAAAHSPSDSDRNGAALVHLASLSAWIGIPFGHILGPLVVWLVRKDDSDFIDAHGRAAINFQITATLAYAATIVAAVVFFFPTLGFSILMLVLCLAAFGVLSSIFTLIAAAKASGGSEYHYPFALRWI